MSAGGVLFDAPGPRTRARHRVYTVVGTVLLVAVIAFAIWRLAAGGHLGYDKWEVYVTPAYVEAILVDGLLQTLQMAGLAVVAAVVFGVIFGVGKLSDHRAIRWVCWLVVEFFRAVPVLMLMILAFYAIFNRVSDVDSRAYWSVIVALMLYNGAVLAEVFRAGILAVPRGQAEAAYAIGLRKTQVTTLILLPQAVKIMIPAIISQCIVALKDTSLGYYIVAPGLTALIRPIYQRFDNQVATVLVFAGIYIAVNLLLTGLATWVQRRYVGERRILEVSNVAAAPTQA
ncbi:amino acid ABC transporter permease [Nocardioides rotundus]|uniref:amino acid ABC transporter permease n=1 Tax=Nocardioides rotundus TaxID=1774216 RepID=UPI001CC02DCB|nr:amino acid ABC transporter permease [Nocardioides rotundus]UAL30798.1 amino acid ABC transporter permease [Nocardioides rotundus]